MKSCRSTIRRSVAATGLLAVALLLCVAAAPAGPLPAKGVRPINGREYAPAVLELIEHAQSDIILMLYQMRFYPDHPDSVTNAICMALADALDRGVEVRLLMDISDWKDAREGDENEKNRVFARVLVGHGAIVHADPGDVISHQKVVVVDGKVSVVSSHNWSYYSTDKNYEAAVMIWSPEVASGLSEVYHQLLQFGTPFTEAAGPPAVAEPIAGPDAGASKAAAPEVAALEATALESTASEAIALEAIVEETAAKESAAKEAVESMGSAEGGAAKSMDEYLGAMTWMPAESVEISPGREFIDEVGALLKASTASIDIAQNSIEILKQVPPYARPDRPTDLPPSLVNTLVDELVAAAGRGVKVRAVLEWHDERDNSKNIIAANTLTQGGGEVFYDDPVNTLHAKMLVVDATTTVVGSTNWTFNAIEQGNEVSVIVRSVPLAAAMTEYIDSMSKDGRLSTTVGNVPPLTQKY